MTSQRRVVCLLLLCGVAAASGCRRNDFRTAVIRVPACRTDACREIIEKALDGAPGVRVETLSVDFATGRLTLEYDSMKLAMKNIEFLIARAGFEANDIPADPAAAAKLPAECAPSETGR